MKLKTNTIGTVFFGNEQKWYIIKKDGKARYITESQWFKYLDNRHTVNSPFYTE